MKERDIIVNFSILGYMFFLNDISTNAGGVDVCIKFNSNCSIDTNTKFEISCSESLWIGMLL